jgi:ribonuclease P protein component
MQSRHRLRKNEQYQEIFKIGKSFANRYLVIYYKPQLQPKDFRVSLSVSKKVGNAVIRNRVKRLIKAAIAELSNQLQSGYDFVIIARPQAADLDFEAMKKNVTHLAKNAGILK